MSLNKAMLIGNVGKDPEVRYLDGNSQNGQQTKVATFTLATTERYRDRSGEQRENTEWHNIVVWRGLADTVERYVRKGSQIYVEGKIRTRSWTDQAGAKHYTTEIIADTLQLLGRRQDNPGAQPQAQGYPSPQGGTGAYSQPFAGQAPVYGPAAQPAAPQADLGDQSDDLPF